MDVAPLLAPPVRACLPARYVAEAFGYKVEWDEKEQVVVISMEISYLPARELGSPAEKIGTEPLSVDNCREE